MKDKFSAGTKPCYLFFDYDGTVFVHRELPEETKKALQQVRERGHFIILNTGRSRGGLDFSDPVNQGIEWDGKIFGACDMDWQGVRQVRARLPMTVVERWLRLAVREKLWFQLECEARNYRLTSDQTDGVSSEEEFRELFAKVQGYSQNNPVTKLTLQRFDGAMDTAETEVVKQSTYMEIFPEGRNKGIAILDFCEAFSLDFSRCVCFGDSTNDRGMFETCPMSIAMSCAPDSIKQMAAYCATGENGVLEGLNWLFG